MKEITVKLTLLEDMLGTASADKEIHETYIASKADDAPSVAEEIEALGFDEVVEKIQQCCEDILYNISRR